MRFPVGFCLLFCLSLPTGSSVSYSDERPRVDTSTGDALIRHYFQLETARLRDHCLAEIKTQKDWTSRREEFRRQLFEMLGLDPLPERTPLQPVTTGTVEHEQFTVEKIHFQSRPRLYVTGNLYLPKGLDKPAPTILYVCGHGRVKKNGISYGNKVHYQHHGAWFARHGYVCLIIDTIQLGEIEGIHHGTYSKKMWWWHSRGYTPAGVEAWNCIRALDYLESRPEVDRNRIGVTGRSGGGAYSWWIAALDDRIRAAVPVAGITSLENHLLDNCIEGHCDCMYMVNTYEWDFPLVSSLVASRPLLISNTDKDGIFPLDGVYDIYVKTRRIYELNQAGDKLGLNITEGPHKDTQELRTHAFVWFNRFLKNDSQLIRHPAEKFFEPEQLKVFHELPTDERVTDVQEWFVPVAKPRVPKDRTEWSKQQQSWMKALETRVFRGWPDQAPPVEVEQTAAEQAHGIQLTALSFDSQPPYELPLFLAHRTGLAPKDLAFVQVKILDQEGWETFSTMLGSGFPKLFEGAHPKQPTAEFEKLRDLLSKRNWGIAWFAPRGIGTTEWSRDERTRTHILRRFALLGQTADGMRVWDVRRAIQAIRAINGIKERPLQLQGQRDAAVWALYASLFEPEIKQLELSSLSSSHRDGPQLLNVLRFLDIPQAVAMACSRSEVRISSEKNSGQEQTWKFAQQVADKTGQQAPYLFADDASDP